MRFKRNNEYGFTTSRIRKLTKNPISFKGYEGQIEKLKEISGWQDKLREYVDQLIKENLEGS